MTTFPLSDLVFDLKRLQKILKSPISWGSYLGILGGAAILGAGPWLLLTLFGVTTAGLVLFWKKNVKRHERKIIDKMIRESNAAQDQALLDRCRTLLNRGHESYAVSLRYFMERKGEIEKALAESKDLPLSKVEMVETLVDKLVFGVADQIEKIAEIDRRMAETRIPITERQEQQLREARKTLSDQVHEAHDVFEDTWQNLGEIIRPLGLVADISTSHASLDVAIDRLQGEILIAEEVGQRISSEWDFSALEGPVADDVEQELA